MTKKRIVKDYDQVPEEILARVKREYPSGFAQHLISYLDKLGKKVSALPFETEDVYYLIRMTAFEAHQIIEDDDDYDEEGRLRDDFSDDYPAEDEAAAEEEDESYSDF